MATSFPDASTHFDVLDTDIDTYLERHEGKDLLRFTTVGSVDDGKSTLIGRLLVDTDAVYEDQLEDAGQRDGEEVDLARITDGLRAEREQGITIDVAYRYFTTSTRKFIIADTPGHVQYTRNMATGASTADLAIILIDARLGVLQQSRRHAFIASLLGIPHLTIAVNKMDLVDYDESTFDAIVLEMEAFLRGLHFTDWAFIPVSALVGDNVVHGTDAMPWYTGPSILEHLQTVDLESSHDYSHLRFPVQYVIRPHLDYRGFAGTVSSGVVREGEELMVLPSRMRSRVVGIDSFEGERPHAFTPQSVVLRLADEIDISRGDMLAHPSDVPTVAHAFDAMMVWMSEKPLDRARSYWIKHTTRYVRAQLHAVRWHVDLESLGEDRAKTLHLNDIGRVGVTCHRPLYFDAYQRNRATGAFIVIDSTTNTTVAAGMILPIEAASGVDAELETPHSGVSEAERVERFGQRGAVISLPAADREAAYAVERVLFDQGHSAYVLAEGEEAAAPALARAGLLALVAGDASELVPAGLRHLVVADLEREEGAEAAVESLRDAGVLAGAHDG